MYNSPEVWDELVGKLVEVLVAYAAEQVRAGADVLQIFDSWVGCLSVEDYRRYALVPTTQLIQRLQKETRVPIIYFGTDSATLLPSMSETGAEVIGLDWRIPLDEGWRTVGHQRAVQGNLDPVLALCFVAGTEAARRAHSSPGRRAARSYLQPRSRHSSAHAGGQREEPGAICARVQFDRCDPRGRNEQRRYPADRPRQSRAGRRHSRISAEHIARDVPCRRP